MPSNQSATRKLVSAPIQNPPGFPDAHKIYLFAVIVKKQIVSLIRQFALDPTPVVQTPSWTFISDLLPPTQPLLTQF